MVNLNGHLEYLRHFEVFEHLTSNLLLVLVQATKIYHEISSNYNNTRNDNSNPTKKGKKVVTICIRFYS
jgi:hypothetical protein